jgi:hypothetical protein
MLENLDQLLTYARNFHKAASSGQTDLFGNGARVQLAAPELKMKEAPAARKKEKLIWEKELLGFYVSEHPAKPYQQYISGSGQSVADVLAARAGSDVKTGGVISKIQKIVTKSGEPMVFATVEDTTGKIECLVFPKLLKDTQTLWVEDQLVFVNGKLSDKDGEQKLLIDGVDEITKEKRQQFEVNGDASGGVNGGAAGVNGGAAGDNGSGSPSFLTVKVPGTEKPSFFENLKEELGRAQQGPYQVVLAIVDQDGKVIQKIETSFRVSPSPQLIFALERIVGKNMVK